MRRVGLAALAGALVVVGIILSVVNQHDVVVRQVGPGYGPVVTVPRTAPRTVPRTFPPAVVTTTGAPATPTTSAPPATTVPPPATTVPPPPPTALPTLPPPSPPATVDAVAPGGGHSGPPGVGLDVSGNGFAGCSTVFFFFDSVRIGSKSPNSGGFVKETGLAVPGDASAGSHQITSRCGKVVRARSTFVVIKASAHRSAFVTSLNQPRQVPTSIGRLLISAIVAIAALALLAFPSELFNSTLEENYDEVRSWLHLGPRGPPTASRFNQTLIFGVFVLAGGVLYALLSPDFGLNMASVALVIGTTFALLVMSLVFSLPAIVTIRRRYGEWGTLNVLPGSLLIGAVCVALSRLLNFQPGYLYGILAGFAFQRQLSKPVEGRITAYNCVFGLMVCLAAWWARVPIAAAAAKPHAGVWLYSLEACLAAIFLLGVESLVIGLLPMQFLDGKKVAVWNRIAWFGLFVLAIFAMTHVLLIPGSGYVGHTSQGVALSVGMLYLAFAASTVAFWAYFRYRPARLAPDGPAGQADEGEMFRP